MICGTDHMACRRRKATCRWRAPIPIAPSAEASTAPRMISNIIKPPANRVSATVPVTMAGGVRKPKAGRPKCTKNTMTIKGMPRIQCQIHGDNHRQQARYLSRLSAAQTEPISMPPTKAMARQPQRQECPFHEERPVIEDDSQVQVSWQLPTLPCESALECPADCDQQKGVHRQEQDPRRPTIGFERTEGRGPDLLGGRAAFRLTDDDCKQAAVPFRTTVASLISMGRVLRKRSCGSTEPCPISSLGRSPKGGGGLYLAILDAGQGCRAGFPTRRMPELSERASIPAASGLSRTPKAGSPVIGQKYLNQQGGATG